MTKSIVTGGRAVALAMALALAACATGGTSSGSASRQSATVVSGGEYRTSEVTQAILGDYARCLVLAMVRYDEMEPSSRVLVQRAQGDCTREANAWREYYVSQGNDRRRVEEVFAQTMQRMVDEFTPMVEDYRSRGIPLADLVDEL